MIHNRVSIPCLAIVGNKHHYYLFKRHHRNTYMCTWSAMLEPCILSKGHIFAHFGNILFSRCSWEKHYIGSLLTINHRPCRVGEPHKNSHVLDTDLRRKHFESTLTFSSNHLWLEIAVLLHSTVICHLQMVICWGKIWLGTEIPQAVRLQRSMKCRSIPWLQQRLSS